MGPCQALRRSNVHAHHHDALLAFMQQFAAGTMATRAVDSTFRRTIEEPVEKVVVVVVVIILKAVPLVNLYFRPL